VQADLAGGAGASASLEARSRPMSSSIFSLLSVIEIVFLKFPLRSICVWMELI
jgi:hypothetical protein